MNKLEKINSDPKLLRLIENVNRNSVGIQSLVQQILEQDSQNFEDFKNMIIRVNGLIHDTPIKDRGVNSSNPVCIFREDVGLTYAPPIDKEKWLKYLYDKVKDIQDIEEKATILYYGIYFIHAFIDGNTRTARIIYSLVSKGYSDEEKGYYQGIIDSEKGYDTFFNETHLPLPEILALEAKKSYFNGETGIPRTSIPLNMIMTVLGFKYGKVFSDYNEYFESLYGKFDTGNKVAKTHLEKVTYYIVCNMNSNFNFENYIYHLLLYRKLARQKCVDELSIEDFKKIDEYIKMEDLSTLKKWDIEVILKEYEKYEEAFFEYVLNIDNIRKFMGLSTEEMLETANKEYK